MTNETTYKFDLTENEANIILAGLSELPHKVSASIIEKMRNQYIEQTREPIETPAE